MMARTPDLSCNCSELTSKPRSESISSWFRMRSAAAAASGGVSGAIASGAGAGGVSSAMLLLHDHLFQKHVAHMIGRRRRVDPAQKLFLEAKHAFRAFEVVHPQ